jgi:hypothetical protein
MHPLLSQNLSPGFFFMAEINNRSCHKDDDDDNSDLLWPITEEVIPHGLRIWSR